MLEAAAASSRVGVVLMNVGTPAAPRAAEVGRYLREFLMDERVLDMPLVKRWLLVNLIIVPFRAKKSAAAYATIWQPAGSPLLTYSVDLAQRVQELLGDGFAVRVGMRYGAPSIEGAVAELAQAGVGKIIGVPMYPQFSEAATGTSVAALREHARRHTLPEPAIVPPFFDRPELIEAFAEVARPQLAAFAPDHVLFSYHGLPERHVRATDPTGRHCLAAADCCAQRVPANARCYRSHCFHTTQALIAALELAPGRASYSFQSRLGRDPWVKPYTDLVLPALAAQGVRRLAVMCPAFVADCLETLEEIGIRAREQWHALGGEDLRLITSLNGERVWARAVEKMVREAVMR